MFFRVTFTTNTEKNVNKTFHISFFTVYFVNSQGIKKSSKCQIVVQLKKIFIKKLIKITTFLFYQMLLLG